ncbi:hypothetical protein K493DRAFT_319928 [Basidiobolus meristosporus CBS 931.73]|uniref:RING-type E3 ubiquitin transferase n=1 Tax=Basidiobolus meristosporus CBS 931.73 TaxID=1314790 RepID=A0A1Y1XIQ5_9FUNG|nr:hypothetical protein K493DRAFT_319928 [Basidiobolus meristosporus CBS 931.73]|eukprot:ORX85639.1 hypothetical protein K493DRAFT_319928 [Basidiobolus meristosporus CBS 931.73]
MDTEPENQPRPQSTTGRRTHWCHQCQIEITPMMAPHPTCPHCLGEFVEEIEDENDPRDFFAQVETDEEFDFGEGAPNMDGRNPEVVNIVQSMLQQLIGPNASFTVEAQGPTFARGPTTFGGSTEAGTNNDDPNRPTVFSTSFNIMGGAPEGAAPGTNETTAEGARAASVASFSNFIQRLLGGNMESTQQGGGGANANPLWNIFQLPGNAGDYVFGQQALDNIISQLMEQAGRNAPPPAPEDVINNLPREKITKAQVEDGIDCAVCKEDFNEGEETTGLPCHHLFHDGCIRPWLELNGTCPVCRHSLISKEGAPDSEGHDSTGNREHERERERESQPPGAFPEPDPLD